MTPLLILLFATATAIAPAALAQSTPTAADVAETIFSEVEKRIMKRYFGVEEEAEPVESESGDGQSKSKSARQSKRDKKKGLPPGLARKKELPPGLAKRETLPPGLAKRELPDALDRELPEPADGTDRIIVDQSIVLVEKATGKVLDILENVITGD